MICDFSAIAQFFSPVFLLGDSKGVGVIYRKITNKLQKDLWSCLIWKSVSEFYNYIDPSLLISPRAFDFSSGNSTGWSGNSAGSICEAPPVSLLNVLLILSELLRSETGSWHREIPAVERSASCSRQCGPAWSSYCQNHPHCSCRLLSTNCSSHPPALS